MVGIHTLKELNKFNHITFFDENHTYKSSKYGFLTSVTTCLKQFQKPFPREFWLKYKTLELEGNKPNYKTFNPDNYPNLDTSIIEREWETAKLIGTTTGSQVHNYLENRWLNKVFPENYTERFQLMKPHADRFYDDYSKFLIPIRLELVLGNEYLAGQIDGLFYNTITNSIWLVDYKTDKKIKYTNYFQKLLFPLDRIDDCSYSKYCLQLNLYKFILEEITDLKVEKMIIIWFNTENYQTIDIPNMPLYVNNITNYIQSKNTN